MPGMPETRLLFVIDTTVLSNFAAVSHVPMLERLYRGRACTTLMVTTEIQHGLKAGYEYLQDVTDSLTPLRSDGWLPIVPLETAGEQGLYAELSQALGPGEASCLAVAVARQLTLATDDLAARRAAAARGVKLTGTLGILVRLVREKHLTLAEANNILTDMIALHYRTPVNRLDDLI